MSHIASLMVQQVNNDLSDPAWCERYNVENGHSIDSIDDFDALHVEHVEKKNSLVFTGYVTVEGTIFRLDWEMDSVDQLPKETFDYWIDYSNSA